MGAICLSFIKTFSEYTVRMKDIKAPKLVVQIFVVKPTTNQAYYVKPFDNNFTPFVLKKISFLDNILSVLGKLLKVKNDKKCKTEDICTF